MTTIFEQELFISPATLSSNSASWDVTVNPDVLNAMFTSPERLVPSSWIFNLAGDLSFTLQTTFVEPANENGAIWWGEMPHVPGCFGYIARVAGNEIAGCLWFNGTRLGIHTVDGSQGALRISRFAGRSAAPQNVPPVSKPPVVTTTCRPFSVASVGETTPVITILPVYGPAMAKVHDVAQITAQTLSAQALVNKAFSVSKIDAKVEYLTPVLIPEITTDDLYVAIKQLQTTKNQDTPMYMALDKARDNAKADIVALLFQDSSPSQDGVVGMGTTIPEPASYDASDLTKACFACQMGDPVAMAHELGHLLGGKHDRVTMPWDASLKPEYDYARGYISENDTFITIMGYEGAINNVNGHAIPLLQIPAFSSADSIWQGEKLGIPEGLADAADNATYFRQTIPVIASYRGDGTRVWGDIPLTVAAEPTLGGYINVDMLGPYIKGSSITVSAVPRVGYHFVHWTLDGRDTVTLPTLHLLMDEPHTLVAHFADTDVRYQLSFASEPVSNVVFTASPEGPYLPGTHVTLTASVTVDAKEEPFRFIGWIVDDEGLTDPLSIITQPFNNQSQPLKLKVEKNHTVKVLFKQKH
jgi:hypothetical protein